MRVFVTGATGWIGSAAVDELLAAGHDVTGLARSEAAAAALQAKGATVRRGHLADLGAIRSGADAADAVLHLAYTHDWSDQAASAAAERAAVQAIGDTLAGSGRAFLLASGMAALVLGRPVRESDPSPFVGPDSMRGGSENLALDFVDRGVRTVPLRFAPTVHGAGGHGFLGTLTAIARERGVSGYPGDGSNRWSAVHVSDAARLVVLALEGAPGGTRVHAAAEEGVSSREIAEAIGRSCDLPVAAIAPDDVAAHFGWIGRFFGTEMSASSTATRELLGWNPTGPTLLEDIAAGVYAAA